MVSNHLDAFLTQGDPSRPAEDVTGGINERDLNVSPKEIMPFSSDFKHAHVAAQFARFPFVCAGLQPNVRSLGSENRSEPLMLLSARPTVPFVAAPATQFFPQYFVITFSSSKPTYEAGPFLGFVGGSSTSTR